MEHHLIKVLTSDGSWERLAEQWGRQCADYGEDFDGYALDAIPVLRDLAVDDRSDAGVFGLLREDGTFDAVCQANSTHLPGYTGKVLRVRHLLLSPYFDFGEYPIEDYVKVLARMFARTVGLAKSDLRSEHVKFHLRSPADRQFFEATIEVFENATEFDGVAIRGSWLYLTLNQAADVA
ncbi:hypothetical protein [Sphingomonas sp.]|uniref:hypothetical protein n=1 Tax=Sphingomonas sp. TaxID=28214 RepID=UPI001823C048|nr:hypothetical protein [Sphingomonas sp.]MBA4763495.1 hypothetical protein [Sphingomonas sp.]